MNFIYFFPMMFILSCAFTSGWFKKLPDYIEPCQWNQKTISECMKKRIEQLRPLIKDGIKELDFDSIDPIFIEKVVPTGGTTQLQATGKNMTVWGASNVSVKYLNVTLQGDEDITINFHLYFPKFHLEGLYTLDATILAFKMTGSGNMTSNALKLDVTGTLHGKTKEIGGVKQFYNDKINLNVNMKDFRAQLHGLFGGNQVMGMAANQFINYNRKELIEFLKPMIDATVSQIILEKANKLVEGIPFDELFLQPDS